MSSQLAPRKRQILTWVDTYDLDRQETERLLDLLIDIPESELDLVLPYELGEILELRKIEAENLLTAADFDRIRNMVDSGRTSFILQSAD